MDRSGPQPPRWRRFELRTDDADELAHALPGYAQRYTPLAPGFSGRLQWAGAPGIGVFRERTDGPLIEQGEACGDAIGVVLPLAASGPALALGVPVEPGPTMMSFASPRPIGLRTPQHLELVGVAIAPRAMPAAAVESIDLARIGRGAHVARLPIEVRDALSSRLLECLASAGDGGEARAPSGRAAGAGGRPDAVPGAVRTAEIVDAMCEALAACEPLRLAPRAPACRDLVRRAHAEIVARLAAPDCEALDVAALCVALGVPRRTLQYGFRAVLGVSPLLLLRCARLAAARRTLRRGGCGVQDAAVRFGFAHFGAFARDYRTLFGELPSATAAAAAPRGARGERGERVGATVGAF